jgi:hydrogenase maturation protease
MSCRARIIGLGQAAAGDDGVGIAIIEWLQTHALPRGIEVIRAAEDSALASLLETPAPVVLVDAVLASPSGEVLDLRPEQLAAHQLRAVSTHGMGVAQAIELARILTPDLVSPSIRIVAVTIERPQRYVQELSAAVAAAVPRAAARVLALVGE